MITTSQATAQHNKAGGGGLILVKPGRKPDDFSSSTDQSSRCNSISATNTSSLENLSGGSDDPTRTSDSARLPSLSGNTDRSNESEVAAAEAENKNKNNRSIDVVNENGESILQQFKGSVASSGQPQA